jgi:hypothetical protein
MTEQVESVVSTIKENHSVEDATADAFGVLLTKAIQEVTDTEHKIKIVDDDGNEKVYTQVAVRNDIFRRIFGFKARILTRIRDDIRLDSQKDTVIVEAVLDMLLNGKYVRVANAFAGKTQYQATVSQKGQSVIQLAETAALGRVLASVGLSGGEFASLEDMVDFNNGEKLSTKNLNITNVQKEKIEQLLKDKNLKMDDFQLVNSLEDLSYQEAMEFIDDLNKSEKKVSTRKSAASKKSANNKVATNKVATKKVTPQKSTAKDKSKNNNDGDGSIL